ncbi:unnamed protein product [Pedinophyceae sp. YPF-701]|nr:unnamed protein product [Pedinophyceae sp. YPF-701]
MSAVATRTFPASDAAVARLVRRAADLAIDEDRRRRAAATALYQAAQRGDSAALRRLLAAGADPDAGKPVQAGSCATVPPLCAAAARGHTEAIRVLLEAGASPEGATPNGARALHLAARKGLTEAVRLLVAAGADTAAVDFSDHQPLYYACTVNKHDTVRVLAEAGAPTEAATPGGHPSVPALHVCAKKGHAASAGVLLACGAHVDVDDGRGMSPLYVAAREGHHQVVQLLAQYGANVDWFVGTQWNAQTPLMAACMAVSPQPRGTNAHARRRFEQTVLVLADLGAEGGGKAIEACAARGMFTAVRVLLERAAAGTPGSAFVREIVRSVPTAIRHVATCWHVYSQDVLARLLVFHFNVAPALVADRGNEMAPIAHALRHACSLGRTPVIEGILDAVTDAGRTLPVQDGMGALAAACSACHPAAIGVLLERGVGFDADGMASEALVAVCGSYSAIERRVESAKLLIATGRVDVNYVKKGIRTRITPLEQCCSGHNNIDAALVELLLDAGARPVLTGQAFVLARTARSLLEVAALGKTGASNQRKLEAAQKRCAVVAMIDARRAQVEAEQLSALASARRLDLGLYDALRTWMQEHEGYRWKPAAPRAGPS